MWRRARFLGPGVVAGASDNDPTTVATLAIVGATTTYGLLWVVVAIVPMTACIQSISAQVGVVCHDGLQSIVRERYGFAVGLVCLVALFAVNVLTLCADLEAGAAALSLLTNAPLQYFVLPFAAVAALLLVFGRFTSIENALKYVALVFFAYVVSAMLAHPAWRDVAVHAFVPRFVRAPEYAAGGLALLGTTLTSYAYVWETIAAAEHRQPVRRLGLVQADAALGMLFAGFIFFFIVVATGATLGVHHRSIETAQDAARALAPLAGRFASLVFGVGLLASALLAVPILAATCAYVMAEALGWRGSLDAKFAGAPRFYTVLVLSLAAAAALTYLPIAPMHLLFLASIAGGFGTPVTLILLLLIARDRTVMGDRPISTWLAAGGWCTAAIVVGACVAFLVQTFVH